MTDLMNEQLFWIHLEIGRKFHN